MNYLANTARTSLRVEDVTDTVAYENAVCFLEGRRFWIGRGKVRRLWMHQKEAIALAIGYVCSKKTLSDGTDEAALIKMPTGTGKSGVVAVLARCVPAVRHVLVLTPRAALTDQLKDDIAWRFWRNIGLTNDQATVWSGDSVDDAIVERLMPNQGCLKKLLKLPGSSRRVLVGTLQALDQIRAKRDGLHKKRLKKDLTPAEGAELATAHEFIAWLKEFDLVIVDEGHYEPAPSWSRSVRELGRPTVLLSATPFRNDYKLFRVKGRFVFNFPFGEARDQRIIRNVEIIDVARSVKARTARHNPFGSENDDLGKFRVSDDDREAVNDFVHSLRGLLPELLTKVAIEDPKVIVRAGSFEILELLQDTLRQAFNELPVLIHERVLNRPSDVEHRRYQSVQRARQALPNATFWLHQTKLLEGIDEPTYAVSVIFDRFSNARQLVQQIGRVIRSTDAKRKEPQQAFVVVPAADFAQTLCDWGRYLEFEQYAGRSLERIVPSEAYLPEKIVEQLPEMQYVDGRFRHRLPSMTLSAEDILLPRRAAVFEAENTFDLANASKEIEESVLAKNRFVVRPMCGLPSTARGWTYFTVDESPYLATHFISEWRFGVSLVARIGNHVFVYDSDGVPFDPRRVDLRRPDEDSFTRLLPSGSTITQVSARSLDMSDRAIRSLTQRTRSFADTFTDLLDPVLRPTAVNGFVNGTGRYLGVVRRKVADAADENIGVASYLDWLSAIQQQLSDPKTKASKVFDRYAERVSPDPRSAAATNILLDLSDAVEAFDANEGETKSPTKGLLAYEDFCADIDDNGAFVIRGLDGEEIPCAIEFLPKSGRYRISSNRLNERHPPKYSTGSRRAVSLTEKINTVQSFRVLTSDANTVYMYGDFLRTRDILAGDAVLPLECAMAIPELRATTSEKGEKLIGSSPPQWKTDSVFGLVKGYCDSPGQGGTNELERLIRSYDLVLLDDGSQELGDFIAIGERRCAIIHAKASEDIHESSVTALEAVGRQALASLAFCSTLARVNGIKDDRWKKPQTTFNKTKVNLSRIFRNEKGIPPDEIADLVRNTLSNPSSEREVWIVAGRLFDIDMARERALSHQLSNHQRQLLMFLTSLSTACGRGNARLRVFGHPSTPAAAAPPKRSTRKAPKTSAVKSAGSGKGKTKTNVP